MPLMALAISTRFVVDDAIVVMENVVRLMESGVPPMEAALKGSEETGPTVLSMSLSLIAVFIPILFMGGIPGRLFHGLLLRLSRFPLQSPWWFADSHPPDVYLQRSGQSWSDAWPNLSIQ